MHLPPCAPSVIEHAGASIPAISSWSPAVPGNIGDGRLRPSRAIRCSAFVARKRDKWTSGAARVASCRCAGGTAPVPPVGAGPRGAYDCGALREFFTRASAARVLRRSLLAGKHPRAPLGARGRSSLRNDRCRAAAAEVQKCCAPLQRL